MIHRSQTLSRTRGTASRLVAAALGTHPVRSQNDFGFSCELESGFVRSHKVPGCNGDPFRRFAAVVGARRAWNSATMENSESRRNARARMRTMLAGTCAGERVAGRTDREVGRQRGG